MPEDSASAVRGETRRLAAIMFTDIVGFSRQMGADEARMLRLLERHDEVIRQAVTEHHGRVIKTIGDGFLVDFPSVVHAVQCAQRIQGEFQTYNQGKEAPEQIHVRIGIHLDDVVQRDGDVFGDGVNIASLYETLPPAEAHRIRQKLEFHYTPKHGSWLNMAEIEFSVLARQCLHRRIATEAVLKRELAAVETARNATRATIDWQFTTAQARVKLHRLYPPNSL